MLLKISKNTIARLKLATKQTIVEGGPEAIRALRALKETLGEVNIYPGACTYL